MFFLVWLKNSHIIGNLNNTYKVTYNTDKTGWGKTFCTVHITSTLLCSPSILVSRPKSDSGTEMNS